MSNTWCFCHCRAELRRSVTPLRRRPHYRRARKDPSSAATNHREACFFLGGGGTGGRRGGCGTTRGPVDHIARGILSATSIETSTSESPVRAVHGNSIDLTHQRRLVSVWDHELEIRQRAITEEISFPFHHCHRTYSTSPLSI